MAKKYKGRNMTLNRSQKNLTLKPKKKKYYHYGEKIEFHYNRAKKDSNATPLQRAYSLGFLNSNKSRRKRKLTEFEKEHFKSWE